MNLHDGRLTSKTSLLEESTFDYGEALKEELMVDDALHEEFIQACDEVLKLIDLIDTPNFWESNPFRPRMVISLKP